ncbi:MAG: hypothetical protein OXI86_22040 [Candidatus Poribacteria bacterium]|nr:hypothetical protein [Candidatus Poribacteria bacterium]
MITIVISRSSMALEHIPGEICGGFPFAQPTSNSHPARVSGYPRVEIAAHLESH